MSRNHQRWNEDESQLALAMHKNGRAPGQIAQHLDRSEAGVRYHLLERYGIRFRTIAVPLRTRSAGHIAKQVPANALAERERAYSAARTPNQIHLGDPLPGRSALDRRRTPLSSA
jgi:hypothetical protein